MANVPSLGDESRDKMFLQHSERELPSQRKELIAAIENILALGKVQKIVIEIGRPIKFSRLVSNPIEVEEPTSVRDDDVFSGVRNSEMMEFVFEKELPLTEYLFKAFGILTQRKIKARAFLVKNFDLLRANLGVDVMWDLSELYGVEVLKNSNVPDDVLVLAASRHGEEDVVFSLRMLMTQPRRKP